MARFSILGVQYVFYIVRLYEDGVYFIPPRDRYGSVETQSVVQGDGVSDFVSGIHGVGKTFSAIC